MVRLSPVFGWVLVCRLFNNAILSVGPDTLRDSVSKSQITGVWVFTGVYLKAFRHLWDFNLRLNI